MRNQLSNTLEHCDVLCLFGGVEDTNTLNRYRVKIPQIIDLQVALSSLYKKRFSLDWLSNLLEIDLTIRDNQIASCGNSCVLPKKTKAYKYNIKNIYPHAAIGDSIRLFLVYQELFIYRKNDHFKVRYFSNIR